MTQAGELDEGCRLLRIFDLFGQLLCEII